MHFRSLKSLRTQFSGTGVELGPGPGQDLVIALLCMHDSPLSLIFSQYTLIPHPPTPCISKHPCLLPYTLAHTPPHTSVPVLIPPHTFTHSHHCHQTCTHSPPHTSISHSPPDTYTHHLAPYTLTSHPKQPTYSTLYTPPTSTSHTSHSLPHPSSMPQ